MPTPEAAATVNAEAETVSSVADALSYQSIIDSANEIVVGFMERILIL